MIKKFNEFKDLKNNKTIFLEQYGNSSIVYIYKSRIYTYKEKHSYIKENGTFQLFYRIKY